MKSKKIITVIAAMAVLSTMIVSCGKSGKDESKTAGSTNTINSTETAKDTETKTESNKEAETTGEESSDNKSQEPELEKVDIPEELKKDNSVGNVNYLVGEIDAKASIEDIQASLFDLVGQSGVTNREILLENEDQAEGNAVVVLFSEKENKNIKLYNVDAEKLKGVNGDFDAYVKDCLEGTESVKILDTLTSTQIVGIRCKSSETPSQIITWEDESGALKYIAVK